MIDVDNTNVQRDLADVTLFAAHSELTNDMDPTKQDIGVIPLETLPAEHYNFLFNRETLRFNNLFKCVKNMLSEFKNLIYGIGGISPSDNPSVTDQVQTFFNTNYPNTTIPTKVAAAAEIQSTDIDSQQGKSCAFAAEKTASGTSTIAKVTPPIPMFLGGTGASNAGDAAFNVLAGTQPTTLDGTESVLLQTTTGFIRKVGLGDLVAHMFNKIIPVGTVIARLAPIDVIPEGWVLCNGDPVLIEPKHTALVSILTQLQGASGGRIVVTQGISFSVDFRDLALMGANPSGSIPLAQYQADTASAGGFSLNAVGSGSLTVSALLDHLEINDEGHAHEVYYSDNSGYDKSPNVPVWQGPTPESHADQDASGNPVTAQNYIVNANSNVSLREKLIGGASSPVPVSVNFSQIDPQTPLITSTAAETKPKNIRVFYLIKY